MKARALLSRLILILLGAGASAGELMEPDFNEKNVSVSLGKGALMDYGNFLTYTVAENLRAATNGEFLAAKGLVIHLAGTNATVCFDTDTLRMSAGWTGGFLDVSKTHLDSYKGSQGAFVAGTVWWKTKNGPGWSSGTADLSDPRPLRAGPLPKDFAHYKGLYLFGDKTILYYSVGSADVYELPWYDSSAEVFTRTFHFAPAKEKADLLIFDLPEKSDVKQSSGNYLSARYEAGSSSVALISDFSAATLRNINGRIYVAIPPHNDSVLLKVLLGKGADPRGKNLSVEDPKKFTVTNLDRPSKWKDTLVMKGRLGFGTGPYVVDTLTVPSENPWKSWLRFTAHDFFPDGRAAVATWNGDVWIVSGIDSKLEKLSWKRFATGLYEGLGLTIRNGEIFVLGRDQITRLHDLNGDGEADFYENFNNDGFVSPNYHNFAMDLWTDPQGNFYYTRCGQRSETNYPFSGAMLRVSADGARLETFAYGLRAANGISVGPRGEVTCSDNEGNWIPSARLNLIRQGGFYGYAPFSAGKQVPKDYDKPLCWLPQSVDNSGGGQAWVPDGRWGPLKGRLIHTSYGKAALFLVFMEEVDGQVQGGAVQLPLRFDTGIMRPRFNPVDGQLYVSGLKGWQTAGARDAALQRVRYTGKALNMPIDLHVKSNGVEIVFSDPLDQSSAADPENFAVEEWNYLWSSAYGSKDYSVANPKTVGHDKIDLKSARLLPDGKTVFLEIPNIAPVMQMAIKFDVATAKGAHIKQTIYNTINKLPRL